MDDLSPYVPSLYLPGGILGRYRSYPHSVRTPIPGAGYKVGKMVWGEQVLDLDGGGRAYPYGSYAKVPLRGLGIFSPNARPMRAAPKAAKQAERILYTASQANAAMGYTPERVRAYWNAKAQRCRGMADEGACLAQVARHVPVTLGGLGDLTPQQVSNVVDVTAQIIANPDATLRARGPAIVTALDTHVVGPLMDKAAQRSAPYVFKYVLPPLIGLYILSGIAAYYSWLDLRQDVGRKGLKMNPRRARRGTARRRSTGRRRAAATC